MINPPAAHDQKRWAPERPAPAIALGASRADLFDGPHIHETIICAAVLLTLALVTLYILYTCIRRHCCAPKGAGGLLIDGLESAGTNSIGSITTSGHTLHSQQPAVDTSVSPHESAPLPSARPPKSPTPKPSGGTTAVAAAATAVAQSPPPHQRRHKSPRVGSKIQAASNAGVNVKTTGASGSGVRRSPRRRAHHHHYRGADRLRHYASDQSSASKSPRSKISLSGVQFGGKSPQMYHSQMARRGSAVGPHASSSHSTQPKVAQAPASPPPPPLPAEIEASRVIPLEVPITADIIKACSKQPPEKEYSLFKAPNFD